MKYKLAVILTILIVAVFLGTSIPYKVTIEPSGILSVTNNKVWAYDIDDEIVEKRTRTSKTHWLGGTSYVLDSSMGAIHYSDNQSNWQEIDNIWEAIAAPWDSQMTQADYHTKVKWDFTAGQIMQFGVDNYTVEFQPMNLEWTNDLDQIELISIPQDVIPTLTNPTIDLLPAVNVTSHQGTIRWDDAYGTGIDFEWKNTASRLVKTLEIANNTTLPTPQQYIIDGGNPVLRLNLIFDPSVDLDIYVDEEAWDKSSKVTTFDIVEFRSSSNITLWGFMPLIYWDSNENISSGQSIATLEKKGNSLYVSIRIPYSWLQTATYPVFLDPTVDIQVSASSDDILVYHTGAAWTRNLTLDRIYLGYESSASANMGGGMRFLNMSIGNSDTIDSANISLTASVARSNTTVNAVIIGEKTASPATFSTLANYQDRRGTVCGGASNDNITATSVDWNNIPSWSYSELITTPDFKDVAQEIVNLAGWQGDGTDDMVIFIDDHVGSSTAANQTDRLFASWDHASLDEPQIHIEYTSGAVAFVRATEGSIANTALTLNIEVSSGTNRMLVAGLAYKSNSVLTPSSVNFNGTESFSSELSATDGGDAQCFLYYLAAPTETTADVVITMPSTVRMVGYVAYFTGVDQSDPFTANTSESQGIDVAPTVTLSSATNEMVIDIMAQVSAGPDTATAEHTQICNGAATDGGTDTRGAGQYVTGDTSITMNYTMSDTDHWNIIAGGLQPPVVACSPDISNTPTTYDFETVSEGSNYTTGLGHFNVTNNSGGAVSISIQGTNMTGGTQWTLSNTATPGSDIYGLKTGTSGDGDYTTIVKLDSPYNDLVSGLADSANTTWGLQIFTPTLFSDGAEKEATVTLTATCD